MLGRASLKAIARVDPGIHRKVSFKKMDCRIKSGNDE